jgi:hypothetical protein
MKLKSGWGPAALVVSLLALLLSLGGTGYALTAGSAAPAARAPAWRNLTLLTGWAYGGHNSYHASFYKDAAGFVHLRGSVTGSDGNALPVFRLPRHDRPSHEIWLDIYAYNANTGALIILPSGLAYVSDPTGGLNVTRFAGFDGVSFPVP